MQRPLPVSSVIVYQLFPDVRAVDVDALYGSNDRLRHAARPWIVMSMISSADGAVSLGGVSGPLGGHADRAVFRHLRSIAAGVIVGAETVRRESYSPLPDHQRLVIVSRSGDLGDRSGALRSAGNTSVVSGDMSDICTTLIGDIWILEGGPTLNAQMLAAECVDEICLTVAPRFIAGSAERVVSGPEIPGSKWDLAHIAHDGGFVFLRYVRSRSR